VIREGSLQADPGLPGLCAELTERLREYRTSLRTEEKEQAEQARALEASREAQHLRTDLVNGLKVIIIYLV